MATPIKPDNPFSVQTPEAIGAEEALSLFVNVFSDFPKIQHEGHTFLHGPRGCGKSMMFRYLQPDCQRLELQRSLKELPFFAVYVPVKNTALDLAELIRLENQHAATVLNEHFLSMYIATRTFESLAKLDFTDSDASSLEATKEFVEKQFQSLLRGCGWLGQMDLANCSNLRSNFQIMQDVCNGIFVSVLHYLKKLSFPSTTLPPYEGPLCGYADFLHPLFREIRRLPFMPGGPIFLMIDDADNLNLTQTRILNSWVSSRTSADVSLKISTQLNYKTYRTVPGRSIDTPHDYSEINISDIYTSSKGMYKKRVAEIVQKRLVRYGIKASPVDFFPPDAEQEKQIQIFAESLKRDWAENKGRGYRASDDVVRYARPMYMASLKGMRKAGHTYSYAGFEQLVHLSSGIIRYFLEAAAQMFSEHRALATGNPTEFIPPSVQNKIARQEADKFMFSEFDKMTKDESARHQRDGVEFDLPEKLRNLVMAMGSTFHHILISDRSERRVFSVALYDEPDDAVREVLRLGVRYGYFHESSIGNKDGTGRTRLYVLSRRLAPFFLLDPTSFAGYLFVKSEDLAIAMTNPNTRLRNIGVDTEAERDEPYQLKLFEE